MAGHLVINRAIPKLSGHARAFAVFDFVVKWHTRVDNFIHLPVKFGEPLLARHESGVSQ